MNFPNRTVQLKINKQRQTVVILRINCAVADTEIVPVQLEFR